MGVKKITCIAGLNGQTGVSWKKPEGNRIKVNADGDFSWQTGRAGIGCVARDSQ